MYSAGAFSELAFSEEPAASGGGVTITCDAGSLVFTGQSATLSLNIPATQGSLVFTGQDASLGYGFPGTNGSLVFTGQSAAVALDIPTTQGSLVFTGQDATFSTSGGDVTISCDPASLVFTGQSAIFTAATDTWGGGWTYYQLHKKEWEELPPKVVRVIEKVARSDKRGDQLEIALRKEIEDFHFEYLEVLQALKSAQLTSVKLLKQREEQRLRKIQDEDDEDILLLLT